MSAWKQFNGVPNPRLSFLSSSVFHSENLFELHVLFNYLQVAKAHFRLNHVKLGQVTRGLAVLRSESRAESVDVPHGRRMGLPAQLSAHCEERGLAEEILAEIDGLLVLCQWQLCHFGGESGHPEHFASALAVRGSDKRRLQIRKAFALEVLVDLDFARY